MFLSKPTNRVSLLFLGVAFWFYYSYPPAAKDMAAESSQSIYEFTVKDIRGNDVPLSSYQGKVLLIVNVASKCGLTHSNYKELNILYEKYKDQGFEILAFPCNQFASQEPGNNEEIEETVCTRFKAEFPIFDKTSENFLKRRLACNMKFEFRCVSSSVLSSGAMDNSPSGILVATVNAKNTAPLYKFLKSAKAGLFIDAIKWNFTKFLVNKEGKVVERYAPTTSPLAIEKDVQNLLGK